MKAKDLLEASPLTFEGAARQISRRELVRLRADGAVHRAVHLSGEEQLMRLLVVALLLAGRAFGGCDLLIQGAVDGELQPLLAALQDKKEVRIAAWTYWTGTMAGKRVVVSRTEMGPINAAAATALGIREFQPAVVINQGTAGANNPELKVFDIVVGERTTDYGAWKSAHGDLGTGTN